MKLSIFRPEDFGLVAPECYNVISLSGAADKANARLNEWLKTEAKKVYGNPASQNGIWDLKNTAVDTHQALLIGIEPIEICQHPKEKVKLSKMHMFINSPPRPEDYWCWEEYKCECGAQVRPTGFEELNKGM